MTGHGVGNRGVISSFHHSFDRPLSFMIIHMPLLITVRWCGDGFLLRRIAATGRGFVSPSPTAQAIQKARIIGIIRPEFDYAHRPLGLHAVFSSSAPLVYCKSFAIGHAMPPRSPVVPYASPDAIADTVTPTDMAVANVGQMMRDDASILLRGVAEMPWLACRRRIPAGSRDDAGIRIPRKPESRLQHEAPLLTRKFRIFALSAIRPRMTFGRADSISCLDAFA